MDFSGEPPECPPLTPAKLRKPRRTPSLSGPASLTRRSPGVTIGPHSPPAAIDAERTILGAYADAELDGDPLRSPADLIILLGAAATILRAETTALAGENHYQALTRALNAYNADNGSTDDWNTWRTPSATPEARIDSLVRIMAHTQALLNHR